MRQSSWNTLVHLLLFTMWKYKYGGATFALYAESRDAMWKFSQFREMFQCKLALWSQSTIFNILWDSIAILHRIPMLLNIFAYHSSLLFTIYLNLFCAAQMNVLITWLMHNCILSKWNYFHMYGNFCSLMHAIFKYKYLQKLNMCTQLFFILIVEHCLSKHCAIVEHWNLFKIENSFFAISIFSACNLLLNVFLAF